MQQLNCKVGTTGTRTAQFFDRMTAFTRQEAKAQQQVQQQAKIAQDLRAMFIALDEDGSGTLTREDRPSKSFQVSSLLALYLVLYLSSTDLKYVAACW